MKKIKHKLGEFLENVLGFLFLWVLYQCSQLVVTFLTHPSTLALTPLLIVALWGIGLFFLIRYQRKIKVTFFTDDARLYEIPQDLAPLLLVRNLYSVDFKFDLADVGQNKGTFSFNSMAQATILDFIQRHKLTYKELDGQIYLEVVSYDDLDDFELAFLEMAFGNETQLTAQDLFKQYQLTIAAVQEQYAKDKERPTWKAQRHLKIQFRKGCEAVTQAVCQKEKELNLPPLHREKTKEEARLTKRGWRSLQWSGILSAAGLILLVFFEQPLLYLYLLLTVLTTGLMLYLYIKEKKPINPDQVDNLLYWHSFKNMLASIDQFQQAELESVFIWDRILVYATLFGYAEKVRETLKSFDFTFDDTLLSTFNENENEIEDH